MFERQPLNWEMRLIDPKEHRGALHDLYCEILHAGIPLDQFRWKYEGNPLGPMRVWSAWNLDTNRLVGAFSAYERQFIHKGKIVSVYQQADAMVRPECRGHGVFKALLLAMTDQLRREGVLFHFGYTNDQSAPIMRRFAMAREIHQSKVMVYLNGFSTAATAVFRKNRALATAVGAIFSPLIRVANALRGHGKKGTIALEPVQDFDHLPEQWSFEVAREHEYFPFRSREFLRWRVLEAPPLLQRDLLNLWCLREGERIGYVTLFRDRTRNVLKLIDHLCSSSDEDRVACLRAIRRFAIEGRYDAVTTNVASPLYQRALTRVGFLKIKPVRCTIFFLQTGFVPQEALPEDFWLQLPVDRDVVDY